ncbi:hypothetical protein FPL11_04185 [Spiribacter aquaticus]|uniref:DUF3299 domain-containing protein n=2 Tax=Spiribacter TaxID=1335745 RepID=A0A557RJG2_9GAMM|nr:MULTISPECIES: hypothetical protein [Spiribacter]AUB78193.1 hypothetical protein BBH56_03095 [Spiribacter roseus]KAF0280179.1 hypothetical protein BA897_05550 [Spiribacter roseus]KAF0285788.1 hypothetical protein BA899_00990 [Spiribacter sp. SSL99]TVO65290.1 hypothetical protein FPL11_04185 [Spiribacter aquaticus]
MTSFTRRRVVIGLAAGFVAGLAHNANAKDILKLRELYDANQDFSALAKELQGTTVKVEGFMAPPLKADIEFFVLTKKPMSVCPFCETEAEWPDDILAVYTRRGFDVVPFNRGIEVTGELALGPKRDPETGFLSMVRIENARFSYG